MTRARLLFVAALMLPAAACGSSPTSPTSTTSSTTTATTFDVDFEAALAPGESSFYSFKTTAAGPLTVTLASVVRSGQFAAVPVHLRIGLGVPAGEGCAVTESVDVTPSLTPQLVSSRDAGLYCVSVADIGELTGTVLTTLRYRHS